MGGLLADGGLWAILSLIVAGICACFLFGVFVAFIEWLWLGWKERRR